MGQRMSGPVATIRRPQFFEDPEAFSMWLSANHSTAKEVWVGFHKTSTGKPSLTWPESVDEALCYGWIDGIRRAVDPSSYAIRFTPRRPGSSWSAVNIRRAQALIRQGRMQPSGLQAFEDRHASEFERFSYANRPADLPPKYLKLLKANKVAWAYYRSQPPWYRKAATWWVISAKREETKLSRLSALIADSAAGKRIRQVAAASRTKR